MRPFTTGDAAHDSAHAAKHKTTDNGPAQAPLDHTRSILQQFEIHDILILINGSLFQRCKNAFADHPLSRIFIDAEIRTHFFRQHQLFFFLCSGVRLVCPLRFLFSFVKPIFRLGAFHCS